MRKFYVMIREVHISTRLVEAENEEEAMEFAANGDEVNLEYSHTLDKDTWTTEEETNHD